MIETYHIGFEISPIINTGNWLVFGRFARTRFLNVSRSNCVDVGFPTYLQPLFVALEVCLYLSWKDHVWREEGGNLIPVHGSPVCGCTGARFRHKWCELALSAVLR